ncbi:MAG: tRNA (adenosine(37)-N6)-dimethylallyltransferase MiaA [Patescibacteria group bacterium]
MSIDRFKPKIIVILGPTASGKSDLAVDIALWLGSKQALKKFGINGAEIISADSRQVYKGLDIGSGKITKKEMKGVPHHLLDVASPKRIFTVSQYQKIARKAVEKILKTGKLPIVCGGAGLYIDSIIYGIKFPEVPPQKKLRKELEKLTTEELFKKLQKLDRKRAKSIDKHNRRRLIRALEIVTTTGKPVPLLPKNNPRDYAVLKIGVKKSPEQLKTLIKKRLSKRLKQGMIGEVENLHKNGAGWKRLDNLGLEYRYVSRYLRGIISKKEMIETLQKEIWRYAKRQMTWFKKDPSIHWVSSAKKAGSLTREFLISDNS